MGVCYSFNATKLNKEGNVKEWLINIEEEFVTFSIILGKGPPPPSPFPNTSREMSEDSRF